MPIRSPHDKEISRLAVPAFGALVAEPLYILADTAVVGRLGTDRLAGLALASAVLLAARTALGANRDTIEIVHMLGGTDAQIACVFQRSIGIDAAAGGLVGLGLGVVVILFLGQRFAALGAGLVDGGALGWADWLLLGVVPLAGVALAVLTARLTVLAALRRIL